MLVLKQFVAWETHWTWLTGVILYARVCRVAIYFLLAHDLVYKVRCFWRDVYIWRCIACEDADFAVDRLCVGERRPVETAGCSIRKRHTWNFSAIIRWRTIFCHLTCDHSVILSLGEGSWRDPHYWNNHKTDMRSQLTIFDTRGLNQFEPFWFDSTRCAR